MKLLSGKGSFWKLPILVWLFATLSSFCFARNRDDIGAERFFGRDVPSQNVLQKIAQDIDYNQMILILQQWTDGEWANIFKVVYMYDDKGNYTEAIQQSWIDDEWGNSEKGTFSYDDQGNMTEVFVLSLKDGEWSNYIKENYTYDDQGNMAEGLSLSWEDGEWTNASKTTNTYDGAGNLAESLNERWSGEKWETSYQARNTYDDQGQMIETLNGYTMNDEIIVMKTIFTYDDQGLKTEELRMSYLQEEDEFVNSSKITYTYNDQEQVSDQLQKSWRDGEWVNTSERTNTYDEQDRMTESISQYLRNGVMTNSMRSLYSYDFIIHIAENSGDTPEQILLSANYPNPFNLSTTIRFSLPRAGHAELVIFNVTGQKVRSLLSEEMVSGDHVAVWDGCDDRGVPVTTGVYFSRLTIGNSSVSGRMMLVK